MISENIEMSETELKFKKLFDEKLSGTLSTYEAERVSTLHEVLITIPVLLIIGSVLVALSFYLQSLSVWTYVVATVALFGIIFLVGACFVYSGAKKNFENKIKKKIMPKILKLFGDLEHTNKAYIRDFDFEKSYVVPQFTQFKTDDIITGTYNDVNVDIIEAELTQKEGKYEGIVFDGIILMLDFNKSINSSNIIVTSKSRPLRYFRDFSKFKKIKLEDIKFRKLFSVYSNDEVESRYVLTTAFMERLNNMKFAFKADNITMAFYEDKLYISIYTEKDMFSVASLIKPLSEYKQYATMFKQIESVLAIIDLLKLNQKIGL